MKIQGRKVEQEKLGIKKKMEKGRKNDKRRGDWNCSIRNQIGQRKTVIPGYLVVVPQSVFNGLGFAVRAFGDKLAHSHVRRRNSELSVMIAHALNTDANCDAVRRGTTAR